MLEPERMELLTAPAAAAELPAAVQQRQEPLLPPPLQQPPPLQHPESVESGEQLWGDAGEPILMCRCAAAAAHWHSSSSAALMPQTWRHCCNAPSPA